MLNRAWAKVRNGVQVKRLKAIQAIQAIQPQSLSRDRLLMKLGAARHDAGRAASLLRVSIPKQASTS